MAHLHIIGICGTAMAAIAALAQESGWQVTGSDSGVYPPMSLFLEERGITAHEGYAAANLADKPDLVLVGNAISRGNPELEALLESNLPYCSGAEWFARHVLEGRHPIVVTGTHGKTTTASLVAWLWQQAGLAPGYLIGGIPLGLGQGAKFPPGPWVVVEGDEYDTAFWDKRSKFLHYRPRTLIINNLEFDHADIFPDLEAIRVQFRLLLRTLPANGLLLANGDDPEVVALVEKAYCPVIFYGMGENHPFSARLEREDGGEWLLLRDGAPLFRVNWPLVGRHNVMNGLAAAAAALSHGISPEQVQAGLNSFQGVARRLQKRFSLDGMTVYDDFAHHPTAIATTLAGLRAAMEAHGRLWAVLEPRSNTMRRRIHQERLPLALALADRVLLARPAARGLPPEQLLDVEAVMASLNALDPDKAAVVENGREAVTALLQQRSADDHVVIMSNGGFDAIHERLQEALLARSAARSGDAAP